MAFNDDFIARALLAYSSDLSITDNQGNKPWKIAKLRNNQNLADTMLLSENQNERPDKSEICTEAAKRQDSENKRMKIIAFRNNERAKKKFIASQEKPLRPPAALHDEENNRIQDLESKIDELNDSMTKLKAKLLSSPQSALLARNNLKCNGCLSSSATICPICNMPFCEICMQKPSFHKCAEKH